MSNLPEISALQVAQREINKLQQQLNKAVNREAHLEILAEALLKQRDEFEQSLAEYEVKFNNLLNNNVVE